MLFIQGKIGTVTSNGAIMMYDGRYWQDNVTMKGWYACTGDKGTPDLRGKFIAGAGGPDDFKAGATEGGLVGGDRSGTGLTTLTSSQMPLHSHIVPAHDHDDSSVVECTGKKDAVIGWSGAHTHNTAQDGKHSHNLPTSFHITGNPGKWLETTTRGNNDNDIGTFEHGGHSHSILSSGQHSHPGSVDLTHGHTVIVSQRPQFNTEEAGGLVPIYLNSNIKGYNLIFIIKLA